jgi:hypothetical protein
VLARLESAMHGTAFGYHLCHGPRESKSANSGANDRTLRHVSISKAHACYELVRARDVREGKDAHHANSLLDNTKKDPARRFETFWFEELLDGLLVRLS